MDNFGEALAEACREDPEDKASLSAYQDWLIDHGADPSGKVTKLADLLGKTCTSVVDTKEEIVFTLRSGQKCKLHHQQDCCESVYIEDICGDLKDLEGSPLLLVEEATSSDETPEGCPDKKDDSHWTWTFYRFATVKGYVTIRWYGCSNGYYSESVDFEVIGEGE